MSNETKQTPGPRLKIKIARKPWPVVLSDTARLLDDISKYHPAPDYVRGYARDVRRALKEIQTILAKAEGRHE